MALETKTKNIDGYEIAISQLGAMKGLRMFHRLGRLLTPSLTAGIASIDLSKGIAGVDLGGIDLSKLGGAVSALFTNGTEEEIESITRALLAAATLDNKPFLVAAEIELAGKIDTLIKCVVFAIEVNFGSFFGVLRALGARAPAAKPQPSSESST